MSYLRRYEDTKILRDAFKEGSPARSKEGSPDLRRHARSKQVAEQLEQCAAGLRKPLQHRVLPQQHYVRACVHGGCIQASAVDVALTQRRSVSQ